MSEWIRPNDHLPKESGEVLVGTLSVDGDKFISIQNVQYSAKYKAFNVYDWMKDKKREMHPDYWAEMPVPPKEG